MYLTPDIQQKNSPFVISHYLLMHIILYTLITYTYILNNYNTKKKLIYYIRVNFEKR